MQDLNKIWSSCVETLEKNKIVDDKIILDSLFKPATLEEIEDNQVIITTELKWNIDAILEKRAEIESILSNSFSKPIKIKVLEVEEYKKSKQKKCGPHPDPGPGPRGPAGGDQGGRAQHPAPADPVGQLSAHKGGTDPCLIPNRPCWNRPWPTSGRCCPPA